MYSGLPLSDGEYLRMKEEELERTLRHAESLRELIASLRRFLRTHGSPDSVAVPPFAERKRPSREEKVIQLLHGGELSLDDLARAFKIHKYEMKQWMDERLGSAPWTRTEDGKGYVLA